MKRYLQALAIATCLAGCVMPPRGPAYLGSTRLRVVDTNGEVIRDWDLVQTRSGDVSVRTRDGKRIGTLRGDWLFSPSGQRLRKLEVR